jgi:hypothetical protein
MKCSKLKKESKQPISKIQRTLWELCKQITRKTYGNTCYTCGKTQLEGSNWHTGHMWPKASLPASLKYDLRILRPQCYHCNINLGGNGAVFYARMLKEIGPKKMQKMEQERQTLVKAYDHYLRLIDDYTKILEDVKGVDN